MFARLRLVACMLVALATPSIGNTQQIAADTTAVAGPRLEATATAFRGQAQSVDSAAMQPMQRQSQSAGKPIALMIVGGAAIVLGAVIDEEIGTLFMIGGAVSVLYGLYLYLR